jgi:hypothetical protein
LNVQLTYKFFSASLPVNPSLNVSRTPASVSHSSQVNIQDEGPSDDESDAETIDDYLDESQIVELNRRFPARMLEAMANEVRLRLSFSYTTHNFFYRYQHGIILTAILERP